MKKYLFLIPTLFVMLLNVISCGQIVNAASTDYDMSYFYSDSFLNSLDFKLDMFDYVYERVSPNHTLDNFFFEVRMSKTSFSRYENGSGNVDIVLRLFAFKSISIEDSTDSSNFIILDSSIFSTYDFYIRLDASDLQVKDSSSIIQSGNNISKFFYYNKSDGRVNFSLDRLSSVSYSDYVILYQSTSIDDFPLVPFDSVSSDLNVDVKFTPDLSGDVNRKTVDSNNNASYSAGFKMKVTNNNKFAVQYRFSIRDKEKSDEIDENAGSLSDLNGVDLYAGVRPFVYYSNEWVHAHTLESEELHQYYSQTVNKASCWHYLAPGEYVEVSFKYSQINLVENHYYYAEVYAQKVDNDYASEMYSVLPDSMENQTNPLQLVYLSTFRMLQYSDVKYDPNDSSNGILPFNGPDYYDKYKYSYNAILDEDGNVDYTGKDLYNDPDSWYNNPTGVDSIKYNGSNSHLLKATSYSSLSTSVSGFFSFITSIFNYLPSPVTSIIVFGFAGVVAVCLVKVVFR